MTNEQREICTALSKVNTKFSPWCTRFVASLSAIATAEIQQDLSEKQNEWIYRVLYKYRRQIPRVYVKYKDNPFCKPVPKRNSSNSKNLFF